MAEAVQRRGSEGDGKRRTSRRPPSKHRPHLNRLINNCIPPPPARIHKGLGKAGPGRLRPSSLWSPLEHVPPIRSIRLVPGHRHPSPPYHTPTPTEARHTNARRNCNTPTNKRKKKIPQCCLKRANSLLGLVMLCSIRLSST